MNAADRRRLTPALGVLAVLLVALLIALWAGVGRGAHWNDNAPPPPLPPARAATPPPSVPPLENFAAVWEHPLFSPDRKPIAAPAGGNNNANSGDLELTGVIMLPGLHMALLREKRSGRTLRVREGQTVAGATVVEVKPRSAVVTVNGSRTELPLKVGPAPAPGAGAQTRAPQPFSPVQAPQPGENAEPQPASSMDGEEVEPQDNGAYTSGTAESPARTGGSPPPANVPRQSGQSAALTNKQAADAWAAALKARILKRRQQAVQKQKQDANKQNDGG
jgi:general secretion pathway protein N